MFNISVRAIEDILLGLAPFSARQICCHQHGGAVLDQIDELALSLSFLYCVGLYLVILHGAGPQLNEIPEREGMHS